MPTPTSITPTLTPDEPAQLTAEDGAELIALLNELSVRSWPLGSLADNVYFHFHTEMGWHVQVGRMFGPSFDEWQYEDSTYPTIVDALRAAVQAYRDFDAASRMASWGTDGTR